MSAAIAPNPSAQSSPRLIGQVLLSQGVISEDQLRVALVEQSRSYQLLGRLLVSLGFISEAVLRDALSESLGQQAVDLEHVVVDAAALRVVPQEIARRHRLMPLHYAAAEPRLTVALADPHDIVALDRLRTILPTSACIDAQLAGEAEIARCIDRHYGHELTVDGILRELETGEAANGGVDDAQPVVRLIDALLTDAVKREASDVHFEPEAGFIRIRYRIDGMLRQVLALHKSCWSAIAVRLKVMGSLNIAEARAPQDGHFTLLVSGRAVDFRIAVLPTLHGENVVVRILDRRQGIVPLEGLGLDAEQLASLTRMISRPEGILLVTGPTGSGKTTTLYSLLNHASSESVNIMTLEDPVEYPTPLIRQTTVAETSKLDFADGVRAIMRQDPDIILVGEIRDRDTAAMAFRAAMTGHQVLTTLHSNSAIGAIPRLLDIGVSAAILAGNILGVVAQRLVRRLCTHCREPYEPNLHERRLLGQNAGPGRIFRPKGCEACHFQGYRGRLAIMEILPFDEEIDDMVDRGAGPREIRRHALAAGFRPLAADGIRRVRDGATSLPEVGRVVDLGTA